MRRSLTFALFSLLTFCFLTSEAFAGDWSYWRGPNFDGTSEETGLVSAWSLDGKNLAWKVSFVGRSTPIVQNGRVYVIGRTGAGVMKQRVVACYDAKNGKLVWEHKSNVTHTTVPFTRVGWASLTGDPETGNVYSSGVDGLFTCYSADGKILWEHSFHEEYFSFSGYGGRTVTPIIDEDLVIVSFNNNSWGDEGPMRPRYRAYDKKNGDLVWVTSLAGPPKNTHYSNPVITMINGSRALVTGAQDGAIYAMKVRTGEIIWRFSLAKGAMQSSVVVANNRVYASHSDENFDSDALGRVVCFDASGTGDITKTNEIWRVDAVDAGYASPAFKDGRLYAVTNGGNLLCLDGETGKQYWTFNLGTVGKGSPVVADGKIYATDVNGGFHILKPGPDKCESLDSKVIPFDKARPAEIYGSVAVAYGRVYFTTENGLFCLGSTAGEIKISKSKGADLKEDAPAKDANTAVIQIVPAEIWLGVDESRTFTVRKFDEKGRRLGTAKAQFTLDGLKGKVDETGTFKADKSAGYQAGYVIASFEGKTSKSRVQVFSNLPVKVDFEQFEAGKNLPLWPGAAKFSVTESDGSKILLKDVGDRNLQRHNLFLGPPTMSGYTIQADLYAVTYKRKKPDMGLIANRYYLDMMGKHQRLQVRSWPAELQMMKEVDFAWEMDTWYTMKMRVDVHSDKALIRGKVWKRGEKEPDGWTIEVEDPLPNRNGSPGLYGWSPTDIYYDNVIITRNQ